MASIPVQRFERLKKRGQLRYVLTTAVMVALLIGAVQFFMNGELAPRMIMYYALIGAVVAQLDWRISKWQYDKQMLPPKGMR